MSQFATSNVERHGGRRKLPYVFAEGLNNLVKTAVSFYKDFAEGVVSGR